jgi:phenylalanyl-tRNA synthetase beta subunit
MFLDNEKTNNEQSTSQNDEIELDPELLNELLNDKIDTNEIEKVLNMFLDNEKTNNEPSKSQNDEIERGLDFFNMLLPIKDNDIRKFPSSQGDKAQIKVASNSQIVSR